MLFCAAADTVNCVLTAEKVSALLQTAELAPLTLRVSLILYDPAVSVLELGKEIENCNASLAVCPAV